MKILLRSKELCNHVTDYINCSKNQKSSSEIASTQEKDLALVYLMKSIVISWNSALIKLRDPAAVWKEVKILYQALSEATVDANLCRLQRIKMKF